MTPPLSEPARLFIALWPPADVHAALVAHADAWSWPTAARRTRAERLHITIHFLGQVAGERIAPLREALAVPWEGCDILLDRQEVWPGGIAVLEAQTMPPPLVRLHSVLAQRLAALELPVEARRYRPHVTLARKATGARPPADAPPLRWHAGPAFALVRSLPGGRGYETLQSFG